MAEEASPGQNLADVIDEVTARRSEVIEKVDGLERQAWAARKPLPHLFAVVPVQP